MPYYVPCPNCGANLDPGERCTCRGEETQAQELPRRPSPAPASNAAITVLVDREELFAQSH